MPARRIAARSAALLAGAAFTLAGLLACATRPPDLERPANVAARAPDTQRDDNVPGVRPTHPANSGPQPTLPPVPTMNPQLVSDGQALYDKHCARCHGANLRGQPDWRLPFPNGQYPSPPHDNTGHTWHHGDAWLYRVIFEGGNGVLNAAETGMPAFRDTLTGREAVSIVTYIKAHWSAENLEYQWQATLLGH